MSGTTDAGTASGLVVMDPATGASYTASSKAQYDALWTQLRPGGPGRRRGILPGTNQATVVERAIALDARGQLSKERLARAFYTTPRNLSRKLAELGFGDAETSSWAAFRAFLVPFLRPVSVRPAATIGSCRASSSTSIPPPRTAYSVSRSRSAETPGNRPPIS